MRAFRGWTSGVGVCHFAAWRWATPVLRNWSAASPQAGFLGGFGDPRRGLGGRGERRAASRATVAQPSPGFSVGSLGRSAGLWGGAPSHVLSDPRVAGEAVP